MATTSDGTANSTSMHTNGVGPRELCMLVSSLTTKATVESEMRAALQCLRGERRWRAGEARSPRDGRGVS